MNIVEVLSQVQSVETHEDYKSVTIGGDLDFTSHVWKGDEYLGSVGWGFDYPIHTFTLSTFVQEGNLDKVLSKP